MHKLEKAPPVMTPSAHRAAINALIESVSRRHNRWQVFQDFVAMSAIAISNAIDMSNRDKREADYMTIVRRYSKEDLAQFPIMLEHVVMALDIAPHDLLGQTFMELDMGNSHAGQFFTPYHLSVLIAKLSVDDSMKQAINEKGFVTVSDPAVGGGAMIIAMAEAMLLDGINYQQSMHVTAVDVDLTAVQMAYIQFSLLHIPAIVVHGNTLTLQEYSHWRTPAHVMGLWDRKLRADRHEAHVLTMPAREQGNDDDEQNNMRMIA